MEFKVLVEFFHQSASFFIKADSLFSVRLYQSTLRSCPMFSSLSTIFVMIYSFSIDSLITLVNR